jgi:hypothetical protein
MIAVTFSWWRRLSSRPFARGKVDWRAVARAPVRDELLRRARCAIRAGESRQAEALVMEYGDFAWSDAACLNVRGVIAETRGQRAEARKFWSKSVHVDPRYDPAHQNRRRYFELWNWGRPKCRRRFDNETTLDLLRAGRIRRGH